MSHYLETPLAPTSWRTNICCVIINSCDSLTIRRRCYYTEARSLATCYRIKDEMWRILNDRMCQTLYQMEAVSHGRCCTRDYTAWYAMHALSDSRSPPLQPPSGENFLNELVMILRPSLETVWAWGNCFPTPPPRADANVFLSWHDCIV